MCHTGHPLLPLRCPLAWFLQRKLAIRLTFERESVGVLFALACFGHVAAGCRVVSVLTLADVACWLVCLWLWWRAFYEAARAGLGGRTIFVTQLSTAPSISANTWA